MRELTGHRVNPANDRLTVAALDGPGPGGASHEYSIGGYTQPQENGVIGDTLIRFQNGPIGEVGVNGVTHEALLAIVIDRLEAFQRGPYRCEESGEALYHLYEAQVALKSRTLARMARGVEGTHER